VNYGFQGVLYRSSEVHNLQQEWIPTVFDEERPHCLDVDVALASISDKVRFYAVPASQNPGLLNELPEGSSRVDINFQEMATTSTSSTTTATTTTVSSTSSTSSSSSAADEGLNLTESSESTPRNTSAPVSNSSSSSSSTSTRTSTSTTSTPASTETSSTTTEGDATEDSGPCQTARFGSECYARVMWVAQVGVVQHPSWYKGISTSSSFEEVQALLHRREEKACGMPCLRFESKPSSKPKDVVEETTTTTPQSLYFCAGWANGDSCAKDITGDGWCSTSRAHCKKCRGNWCERSDSSTTITTTVPAPSHVFPPEVAPAPEQPSEPTKTQKLAEALARALPPEPVPTA